MIGAAPACGCKNASTRPYESSNAELRHRYTHRVRHIAEPSCRQRQRPSDVKVQGRVGRSSKIVSLPQPLAHVISRNSMTTIFGLHLSTFKCHPRRRSIITLISLQQKSNTFRRSSGESNQQLKRRKSDKMLVPSSKRLVHVLDCEQCIL